MADYNPISLRRPIAELERLTSKMILWFQPQNLPMPVITIQGNCRIALGWFAKSRWESRDGGIHDEINFVAKYLDRDVFDIAETLVHELAHLANHCAGIRDCSSNQYHNRKFRDRALSVGLTCERYDPFGWAKTGLTPALRDRIAGLQPDASAFDMFRLPPAPAKETLVEDDIEGQGGLMVKTKQPKLSKWQCYGKCAAVWVASGKKLTALCLTCEGKYERMPGSDSKG